MISRESCLASTPVADMTSLQDGARPMWRISYQILSMQYFRKGLTSRVPQLPQHLRDPGIVNGPDRKIRPLCCVRDCRVLYFVRPPSTFSLSVAAACAAASRAVRTRNGDQET